MKVKFYSFVVRFSIGESFSQEVQEIACNDEQAKEKALLSISKAYGRELSADAKILSIKRGEIVSTFTV